MFSPFNEYIKELIHKIEEIYEWLEPWLKKHNKIFFTKQIKFTLSDSENSFLDYLLLWLDGQNSTEMPKIESATTENQDDDDFIDSDEE